jgi:ubiquinone/menaquinone biosynthesis C-methylase UbiE
MRRAEGVLECLDRPAAPADLAATLAEIDRLNAWFGGYDLTLRAVRALAAAEPAGTLRVADVGGGRGDLAVRLARWARSAGRRAHIVVVDRDLAVLGLARRVAAGQPEVALVCADATALPFRDGAADVVTVALTIHHLEPDDVVAALAGMRAIARRAVVVNDLLRTRLTLGLVWLATRLVGRHRFTRLDGPLSVRRAYTPDELRGLAEKAGIRRLAVTRHPMLGRLLAIAT